MLRSSGFAAVGTVSYSVCQFLILVSFAQLGDAEMLGRYALALAVTAPIFMFSNMRLRFVVATDLKSAVRFTRYFGYRVMSSIAGATLVVVGAAITFQAPEIVFVFIFMSLLRLVESLSDIVYGLYQRSHKLHLMAASMTMAGAGMLIATAMALKLQFGVAGVLILMLISRVLVFAFFDLIKWFRYWRPETMPSTSNDTGQNRFGAIFRRCWPLGVVALLVSLNTNIPRYFIEYLLGSELLGIFAALAYVPIAGYMVVGTMGQTVMPQIARSFDTGDIKGATQGALGLYGFGAAAGVLAVLAGVFLGEEFLGLAYGSAFAEYSRLFIILLCAGAVSYVVVGAVYVLTAAGYFKSQMAIYVMDLLIVASLCVVLIPQLGITGSAVAMLVSQISQVVLATALIWIILRRLGTTAAVPPFDSGGAT